MRTLLQNRPFRRLFTGRLVTNAGDSLYFVAAMWLVWDLTGNEFYSGLAGFLTLAPSGLQFLFGPLVDRWPLRRLLVGTQLLQGLLMLAVPAAHLTGYLSVWVVLAVMPALALVNQLSYPAETAALPRLVDREELVRANSLFALAYQGVDAVFNALAGVLVAVLGAVAVFALDAATFAVAAAVFATVRVPRARAGDAAPDAVADADETPRVAAVALGWFPGTALLFLLAFVPVGVTNVLFAAAMQALVPEPLLGRVSAVLGSASAVATPLGALAGGTAAASLGPTLVMGAASAGFLGLALYVAAIPALRRLPAVTDLETLAAAEPTANES